MQVYSSRFVYSCVPNKRWRISAVWYREMQGFNLTKDLLCQNVVYWELTNFSMRTSPFSLAIGVSHNSTMILCICKMCGYREAEIKISVLLVMRRPHFIFQCSLSSCFFYKRFFTRIDFHLRRPRQISFLF